jgi:hypothetical protein
MNNLNDLMNQQPVQLDFSLLYSDFIPPRDFTKPEPKKPKFATRRVFTLDETPDGMQISEVRELDPEAKEALAIFASWFSKDN